MRTKKQTRKYYLHRRLRQIARLDVGKRQISIPFQTVETFIMNLNRREKKYLNEIRSVYGYTIQSTICTQ